MKNLIKKVASNFPLVVLLTLIIIISLCLPIQADGPEEALDSENITELQGTGEEFSSNVLAGTWQELEFSPYVQLPVSNQEQEPNSVVVNDLSNVTLFADGFEGSFPGAYWGLSSDGAGWGQTTYKAYSGSKSVWCAGSSLNPASSNYPQNADAWMAIGPFNLSKVTSGNLSCFTSILTQYVASDPTKGDLFIVAATTGPNAKLAGYYTSGQRPAWDNAVFDLTKWPTYKNLCGKSTVYFLFGFVANGDSVTDKGAFLDDVSLTVQIPTPPNAPTNLAAEAVSSKQVNLTWQDNSNDETGFYIERAKTGDAGFKQIAKVKSNISSYTDSKGLAAYTDYIYRVRAYNKNGNSDYTNEDQTTTLSEPPSPPTLTSPKKGAKKLGLTPTLSWSAPKKGQADSYLLQISTDTKFGSVLWENSTPDTSIEVPEKLLNWNNKYSWRVAARNLEGSTSDWSSAYYFTTALGPPPEDPSNLEGKTLSDKQIQLNWLDNSDDETGFYIERKKETETKFKQIKKIGDNLTEYLDKSGLKASTTYVYRICAYNAAGNSDYCENITVTTWPVAPNSPKLNTSKITNLTPELSWKAPTKGTAEFYQLQVATDSKFTTTLIDKDNLTVTNYVVDDGLLNWNTKYYWRVRAIDSYEQTSPWASKYFKTPKEE